MQRPRTEAIGICNIVICQFTTWIMWRNYRTKHREGYTSMLNISTKGILKGNANPETPGGEKRPPKGGYVKYIHIP